MPSSSKTNYLSLNHWSAGDKPKMADFNSDNQRIDNAIQAHEQNGALHLAGSQSAWLAQPFVTGGYPEHYLGVFAGAAGDFAPVLWSAGI